MTGPVRKKILPKVTGVAGVLLLCGAMMFAQGSGQRSDGQIEMDVVHALDSSNALKTDLITAATVNGEVTLSGTVSSEASKELAESIAGRVPGVSTVHNNLKVGNPQDAQAESAAGDSNNDPQMADEQQPAEQAPEQASTDNGPVPPPEAYPQASGAPDQTEQQPAQASAPPRPAYTPTQPPAGGPQYPQSAPGYPQQGAGYPPAYPQQGPGYPPQGPGYPQPGPAYSQPAPVMAKGPATIPQGTLLQLRTNEPVSSKDAKPGQPVQFTVIQDVDAGGGVAIPRGATVHGEIVDARHAGTLAGSPELALKLTSLDLGGRSYPLQTDLFKVKGPDKTGQTVTNAIGGGILGTIIGCAAGRGAGCAIGAGAGVAAGTAASAASGGPSAWIPAEAKVDFHLTAPVTVNPVSQEEAMRLAQGLYQGGPVLYRRGGYYGPRYYAGPGYYPPYPPPVYYRPYYFSGGFYYWR